MGQLENFFFSRNFLSIFCNIFSTKFLLRVPTNLASCNIHVIYKKNSKFNKRKFIVAKKFHLKLVSSRASMPSFKQDNFHLKQVYNQWLMKVFRFQLGQHQMFFISFSKNTKIHTLFCRIFMNVGSFYSFHSYEWSEKIWKLSFAWFWKNSKQKDFEIFIFELNFNNFQEKKNEEVLGWLLQHSHNWDWHYWIPCQHN